MAQTKNTGATRSFSGLLRRLESRVTEAGLSLRSGRPLTARQLRALEERAGVPLSRDYREFLSELGGAVLSGGDRVVWFLDHGLLLEAKRLLEREHGSWWRRTKKALVALPTMVTVHRDHARLLSRREGRRKLLREYVEWSDCYVLDSRGRVRAYHRGTLEPAFEGRFFELFSSMLEDHLVAAEREVAKEAAATAAAARSSQRPDYGALLAKNARALARAGIGVRRGKASSRARLGALERALGIALPVDYRHFLLEVGGVRLWLDSTPEMPWFLGPAELIEARAALADRIGKIANPGLAKLVVPVVLRVSPYIATQRFGLDFGDARDAFGMTVSDLVTAAHSLVGYDADGRLCECQLHGQRIEAMSQTFAEYFSSTLGELPALIAARAEPTATEERTPAMERLRQLERKALRAQ